MQPWLIALVVALALVAALLFVPIRIRFSLRGRGDPSGAWAVAGGAQLGPLALSAVAARGVPAAVAAHVFGKKLWERTLSELGKREPKADEADDEQPKTSALDGYKRRYDRLERWFDPLDLMLFLTEERRRIRVEQLDLDVVYSFEDVALTGKVLAALYVLAGILPPPISIRPRPTWESVDRADLALAGSIRVWPGLLLVDSAWFVVRRAKLRKRRIVRPTEAT